jgi:hypothetical protein
MANRSQRRKRSRPDRNQPGLPSIAPWPPDVDVSAIDVRGVDALDPSDPDVADLVTATGIIFGRPGQRRVPVTVWRVAATDHAYGQTWDGLSPRVAGLPVSLTTRPGDTIIDFDNDPTVAGVAGAHGVRLVPVTCWDRLRRLAPGAASLITLRYPVTDPTAGPADLPRLFAACARLQAPRGSTVVAIVPPPDGPDYAAHAADVIPAAEAAGLGYVQHVIAVTAPIAGEWLKPPHEPDGYQLLDQTLVLAEPRRQANRRRDRPTHPPARRRQRPRPTLGRYGLFRVLRSTLDLARGGPRAEGLGYVAAAIAATIQPSGGVPWIWSAFG